MAVDRTLKIGEEMRRELSDIIRNDVKDPRVRGIITVTKVNVTKDLRYAKVFISVYGDEKAKGEVMEGLKNSSGFIRKEIGMRIKTHYTPDLDFELDKSIEYGMKINEILSGLKKKED